MVLLFRFVFACETPVCTCWACFSVSGLTQEGLFRVDGSMKAVEQLQRAWESGVHVDLGPGDVRAAASLLKRFLRELPGGLVPSVLRPRLLRLCHGQYYGGASSEPASFSAKAVHSDI